MVEITNNAQLRAIFVDVNQEVCEEVIDNALECLKDTINEVVYSVPNGGGYMRTMQFQERAWETVKQKLTTYVAQSELYYTPSNYIPVDDTLSPGAHANAEQLAELIIKGYDAYGDPNNHVAGRDYWTAFKAKFNAQWDDWVKSAYRKRGLKVY